MLPDIHRATQKFYIFLIVYLTGCTPLFSRGRFFLPAANTINRKRKICFQRPTAENILPFPVMQSIVINPIQNT